MKTKFTLVMALMTGWLLNSCIENDVDYPYTAGVIMEFSVEGITQSATINKSTYTVQAIVSEDVDLQNLTITRLTVENNASIYPDETKAIDAANFPEKGFASLDSVPASANTKINFTTPVNFLLETYQEYEWTISVTQLWNPYFMLENINELRDAFFDKENKQVILYVPEGTELKDVRIENIKFYNEQERVTPDPWETVFDFRKTQQFEVTVFGRTETWTVNVLESNEVEYDIEIYPRTRQAVVTGKMQAGSDVLIEYKRANAREWRIVSDEYVTIERNSFSAMITGLSELSQYNYRVTINNEEVQSSNFTTASAELLTNGSFDDWNEGPGYWAPWPLNGVQYWSTGNEGTTVVGGASNSVPDSDTSIGTGRSAKLESVFAARMKFAAGNIFVGEYVDTDETNGILSFGQPFYSFPTKLRFDYKYISKAIDRCDDNSSLKPTLSAMIGQPDTCIVYFALTDWDTPREIRTRPNVRQLFDVNDEGIIAYGEFTKGETTEQYQTLEVDFVYRNNRTPKYLVIVATASKYGDYFTGGVGSTLWLDEMELIYD